MPPIISTLATLWLIACLTQLYYWLVVVWSSLNKKISARIVSDPVSIIICTNQHTDSLENLLIATLTQDYPEFEVILVNDGGLESVDALVRKLQVEHENLTTIHFDTATKQTGGKKEPLTLGIAASKYRWLLLTDADCTVRPGWIQSMMNHTSSKKSIVLGYGPFTKEKGLPNAISRLDTAMIAMQYMGMASQGKSYMGVGRNLLYHKRLFEKVGGFDGHLDLASGDDDLFIQAVANRENVTINLQPESFVYSASKLTWRGLFAQKTRHISTSKRYSRTLKIKLGMIGMSFIWIWLTLLVFLILASPVPIALCLLVIAVQWFVFTLFARRTEMTDFIPLFPLWAILYAIFLAILGIIALFGKTPKTWNAS